MFSWNITSNIETLNTLTDHFLLKYLYQARKVMSCIIYDIRGIYFADLQFFDWVLKLFQQFDIFILHFIILRFEVDLNALLML